MIDPIEEAINELDEIKDIVSVARDGYAVVQTEFEAGVNMDDKYSEIVQKVNGIRDDLPDEIADLDIQRWRVTDVCILQLGIISNTASYRELEYEAKLLKDALDKVPGVKKVETMAFPEQEVRVALDLARMAQYRLGFGEVMRAIEAANAEIPGGYVDVGGRRLTIQTTGSFESLEQLEKVVVRSSANQVLYLRDIADVSLDYDDKTYFARVSGERAVFVTVKQKERTNIFDVMSGVRATVDDFETQLPADMRLQSVFDQSESVARRMNTFSATFFRASFWWELSSSLPPASACR